MEKEIKIFEERATPEPEILELRKAIELEIDAKCNAEIGAKILKIESMNVEQLKELLAEIKSQPAKQTIVSFKEYEAGDVEDFNYEEELNRLIEENKDVLINLKDK